MDGKWIGIGIEVSEIDRVTVLALEGRGGVGGMEGAAMSLEVGKTKELYSCCGVEGAVEKGSDSTSWMVVGAVDTERRRG